MLFLCALLFAAGHAHRDGLIAWADILAPLKGTRAEWVYHLKEHFCRGTAAAICGLGVLASFGIAWASLALWLAVWVGFYTDSDHGEGNEGAQPYALVSGLTSVALAAAALGAFGHYLPAVLVIFVGCLKGPLWTLAYRFIPQPRGALFPPTRVAAGAFGFLFGLAAA